MPSIVNARRDFVQEAESALATMLQASGKRVWSRLGIGRRYADVARNMETAPYNALRQMFSVIPEVRDSIEGPCSIDEAVVRLDLGLVYKQLEFRDIMKSFAEINDTAQALGLLDSQAAHAENVDRERVLEDRESHVNGGFRNAYKSFLGFFKLAVSKLQEAGKLTQVNLHQAARQIGGLLLKLSQMNLALLRLFDDRNGVVLDQKEPYTYKSENFELDDEFALHPTEKFINSFVADAGNQESKISVNNFLGGSSEQKRLIDLVEHETHGCLAAPWMKQFFGLMESFCDKLIDQSASSSDKPCKLPQSSPE